MSKEPGEKIDSLEEDYPMEGELERSFLLILQEALIDAEKEQFIDLNQKSRTLIHGESKPIASKKDALESALKLVKHVLNKFNPTDRHLADGLIIKAELYLAAHEPKKEK